MFIDRAEIQVKGGDGGDGCVSFLRERFRPRGGPDGGDGGRGGSVLLKATAGVDTLLDFTGRHHWRAKDGRPGQGKCRTGHSGEDVVIELPPGTLVYDRDTDVLLKDLIEIGAEVCVAAGGKGGKGNKSFATPTHQVPRESEDGEPGEERWLRLELRLIADVGLVGMPNAGKSTLLSRLSRATPKIAAYPFTTLSPQLGIMELSGFRRIVLADIPGLIEGAHEGAGLGDDFLRHIERTRIIVHLIDAAPDSGSPAPARAYSIIRDELAKFSATLAGKRELVAANKMDLTDADGGVEGLRAVTGGDVIAISAATGAGLAELSERLWSEVQAARHVSDEGPDALAPSGQSTGSIS